MNAEQLKAGIVVRGPIFNEPVQVLVTSPKGESVKLVGKGLNTGQVHEVGWMAFLPGRKALGFNVIINRQ